MVRLTFESRAVRALTCPRSAILVCGLVRRQQVSSQSSIVEIDEAREAARCEKVAFDATVRPVRVRVLVCAHVHVRVAHSNNHLLGCI